jgi:FimV-like protein
VLLIAAVGLALRRRRREAEAETPVVVGVEPARREEPTAVAAPVDDGGDPADRARGRLAAAPADLAAHLALLQALASDDDTGRFSDALEDMFEHVETGAEPAWREALELAGRVVPGHVLVKGSADWMSGAEDGGGAPLDELDEESEVGDLMSRLESEPDEETDDRDWIGEPEAVAPDPQDDALPGLHDDEDERDPLVLGGLDDDDSVAPETGTEELTSPRPDVPDEEDADHWMDDDLVGDAEDDDAVQRAGDATDAAPEPAADDDDRLVMDWTTSSDDETPGSAAAGGDAGTSGDIFAPSDDDVDVKLDLARAYLSWNSTDSAKTLLEEVVREGNDEQKEQAQKLLDDL